MTAWILSATLALLMVNMPGHFVGWLGHLAGDLDLSLLAALVLPALLYPALLHLVPEPRAVFGPRGARGVPTRNTAIAPVVGRADVRAAGAHQREPS
jgi:hypothetical protein